MAKKTTETAHFGAVKEFEALRDVRGEIRGKKAEIEATTEAIRNAEESIENVDEQAHDVKRLREQYEDMKADKALGEDIPDADIEALRLELADASENKKSFMAQHLRNADEKKAVLAGLNRRLEGLNQALLLLEAKEQDHSIDFIEAEIETESKEYSRIIKDFDKVFAKLLGLNVWLEEYHRKAMEEANAGSTTARHPKITARHLLGGPHTPQRGIVCLPSFKRIEEDEVENYDDLEALRAVGFNFRSGHYVPDSFQFAMDKTRGGELLAIRIKEEIDNLTAA
jgi:hypothetical protein